MAAIFSKTHQLVLVPKIRAQTSRALKKQMKPGLTQLAASHRVKPSVFLDSEVQPVTKTGQ
jgi:hypothetical protein